MLQMGPGIIWVIGLLIIYIVYCINHCICIEILIVSRGDVSLHPYLVYQNIQIGGMIISNRDVLGVALIGLLARKAVWL